MSNKMGDVTKAKKYAALKDLAYVIDTHGLYFYYTAHDDGVHVSIQGEDIYKGWFASDLDKIISDLEEVLQRAQSETDSHS